jgi:restriction system protein
MARKKRESVLGCMLLILGIPVLLVNWISDKTGISAAVTWTVMAAILVAALCAHLWAQNRKFRALQIADIDSMSGMQFEQYLKKLLISRGYRVSMTAASGDLGVDLIACGTQERIAIQVKRHIGKVSRRAISDAVAGMQHYQCNKPMVITNSHFTPGAIMLAQSTRCTLVDRDELAQWIMQFQAGKSGDASQSHRALAVGMLTIVVLCSLWWMNSHFSVPRRRSLGSGQDNSQQPAPGNSSAAPNSTAPPKPDTNVQPATQSPERISSPDSQQGSVPTAIPSPSLASSPSGTITSPPPAPTVTPTAAPQSTHVVGPSLTMYEVVNCDFLNVRSGAASSYPVVGRLAFGTSGISSTGAPVKSGRTSWLPVSVGRLSGWVNSDFLKPSAGKGRFATPRTWERNK